MKTSLPAKSPSPPSHEELYKRYRPKTLDAVVGQPEAVRLLGSKFKTKTVPHAILFTGPSGCGKTTMCRIVMRELGVHEDCIEEINASESRGIDTVREIKRTSKFFGFGKTRRRGYIWDEFHKMTSDAQNAMLKDLEEPPPHVYHVLATTDPAKVLKTIHSRCTEVRLKPLSLDDLKKIVLRVAKREGLVIKKPVLTKIVEAAEGGARKALVLLESVAKVKGTKDQLKTIELNDSKSPAIQIARALLDSRTNWQTMAQVLRDNKGEDAEGMRRMILGYCSAILLNGKPDQRAAAVIDFFQDNLFDSGYPGLVARSFEVVNANRR